MPAVSPALRLLLGSLWSGGVLLRAAGFAEIEPLLQQHCVECHGAKEPEGSLVLESYADLLKGGESGAILVPGKSAESLLVKVLEGNWGKTGKNQFMPPGKREKLKPEQVALFKTWIDSGAPAPASTHRAAAAELVVPKIQPRMSPRRSVNELAFSPTNGWLAVARPEGIELVRPESPNAVRLLAGLPGVAQTVVFSADGEFVFGAGGRPNQAGEIRQWRTSSGEPVRSFGGPRDSLHSLALSPDGTVLAGGSYDYSITLWNVADGSVQRVVAANQGAVMGLAFRPDGRLLASASYDRTAKLFDAATGTRLETFGQALKELNAVAFSPDAQWLLSGGNDNRIRAYRIGPTGKEGSNELVATVFAHEGALLRLRFSPDGKRVASSADDRTVKLFSAPGWELNTTLPVQPDWPSALTFAGNDRLIVGRMDGTWAIYRTADGQPWAPPAPPKPVVTGVEPRGVKRGVAVDFRLRGTNLADATVLSIFTDHLVAVLRPEVRDGGVEFRYAPAADSPRGPLDFTVSTPAGESGKMRVWVDDLPQTTNNTVVLPAAVWGNLPTRGAVATYAFSAVAGETLLFDLEAQRLGFSGDFNLTLFDATGRVLAQNDSFGNQADPLLLHRFSAAGNYRLQVGEATFGGSPAHNFRLSMGALPFVTGVFPPAMMTWDTNAVFATGANLPDGGKVEVATTEPGRLRVPLPGGWRSRREWELDVTAMPTFWEREPTGTNSPTPVLPVPGVLNGQLDPAGDVDQIRFTAVAGRTYILETTAARLGSTADTRLEIRWPDGRPVERLRLQAVRNSAVTFRATDANGSGIRFENWEEMELNDYLYCGGDVMRVFRAPQGPDSDTALYTGNGRRRAWFDTTATAHYLDEPVYVVTPLAAGSSPGANGLPVFTVPYLNDDASRRDLGPDSRLHFTAPQTGEYLVRVDDPRNVGGPTAGYALTIRPAAPDFVVRLNGPPAAVAKGSGQAFSLSLERRDEFENAVDVEFLHLPAGWRVSSPVRIEAGHGAASVALYAAPEATQPDDAAWDAVRVVASGRIENRLQVMAVNTLGRPKLQAETPKIQVFLDPIASPDRTVVLRPGGTARAKLRIERHGFDGVVTFSVDNLPHGVIVENLGLNGITFLGDENDREISLAAAKWVSELERPFYAVEGQAGRQTSPPLILSVRRAATQAAAK